uniref:Uncharacterized protein n=1 Tax=viral metagenome TaxID=1070528 RepID=A0A6C0D5F5_9ZZZZ
MNNKKSKRLLSKKHKRNKKIRNTRKNYKREGGGKGDVLKEAAKQFIKAATTVKVPVIKKEIYKAIAAPIERNANYLDSKTNMGQGKNVTKDFFNGVVDKALKQKNKENDNMSLKVDVERELKKIAEKEEKVKFSEIASVGWFNPTNALISKINEKQKNAQCLLKLKNKEIKDDTIIFENHTEIFHCFYFLSEAARNEYGIQKNTESISSEEFKEIQSKITKNEELLRKESTFTYNLLKNIDISPEEIFKAYCTKWNKNICKDGDTPMIFLGRTLFHYVFPSMHDYFFDSNNTSNNINPPVTSSVIQSKSNESNKSSESSESLMAYISNKMASISKRLPYTYVVGYNRQINAFAAIRTIYGAIFGFDENWLHYILGILDPFVINIFNDIKKSDNNELDFITLLVSAMSGKTEDEIEEFCKTRPNIRKLKDKLNEFFKNNASSFSGEYTTTHFIGLSEKLKETIKTEVAEQILIIAKGLKEHFEKELLHFIINAEDLGNMAFEDSLTKKTDIDELYEKARIIIKITPEV